MQPNLFVWGFLPSIISLGLLVVFIYSLEIKILGDSKLRKVCKGKGDDKKCKNATRDSKIRFTIIVAVLFFVPLTLGFFFYRFGQLVHDPSMAGGMTAAEYFRE